MSKKIIKQLFVLMICLFSVSVDADDFSDVDCTKEQIAQLKEISKNVVINYEYVDNIDDYFKSDDFVINNMYYLFVSGLGNDLILSDEDYNIYSSDGELGTFPAGKVNFNVISKNCYFDTSLRKIEVKLPIFNSYSLTDECKKLKEYNLEVCDAWSFETLDVEMFYAAIEPYLFQNESFFSKLKESFFENKFVLIGLSVLVLGILLVYIYRRYKRGVLE